MVGLSAPRVLVVPRWGGTATDDWYAWLQSELPGTTVLDLPQPDAPSLQAWTDAIVAAMEVGAVVSPKEAAELVLTNGFQTTSKNFNMMVSNALAKDKRSKRQGPGQYERIK